MQILVCPDKFKGSLSAQEAAKCIASAAASKYPEATILPLPLSDGGEGFSEIIGHTLGGRRIDPVPTVDPLNRPISGYYYFIDDSKTAIIEMATASGLLLLAPSERNPLKTTTSGTGLLIRHAIEQGARKILLGIGGSATHDGGTGMAAALGFEFHSKNNQSFLPVGESLIDITTIKGSFENKVEVEVLTDVNNPFTGKNGASTTFAAQKGADDKAIAKLESGAIHLLQLLKNHFGKDLSTLAGGGAAGGMGAGCVSFLNAQLKSGSESVFRLLDLENKISQSDIIISGEGKVDESTFQGKVIGSLWELAKKHHKRMLVFCGKNALPSTFNASLPEIYPISPEGFSEKVSGMFAKEFLKKCVLENLAGR